MFRPNGKYSSFEIFTTIYRDVVSTVVKPLLWFQWCFCCLISVYYSKTGFIKDKTATKTECSVREVIAINLPSSKALGKYLANKIVDIDGN